MCPISSSEIAALNGGYQQQTMSQMQYSQSIGQGNIYGGGMQQGGGQADPVSYTHLSQLLPRNRAIVTLRSR